MAWLSMIVCSLAMSASAAAVPLATRQVVVHAVDGRSGKPLRNQHLLVFGGGSKDALRQHKQHFEVVTGADGSATLSIPAETRWLQVWVDWHILCAPKDSVFSVAQILSLGVNTPNTCDSKSLAASPGNLVVFVRPAHFWERMRQ